MDLNEILVHTLITSVVGGLISFFLDYRINTLKKLIELKGKIVDIRISAYPTIIKPIYRFRNLSMEFVEKKRNAIDITEVERIESQINTTIEKIKEVLLDFRLHLQDDDFTLVHTFKNRSVYYNQLFKDYKKYFTDKDDEKAKSTFQDLIKLNQEIEDRYKEIADKLSFEKLAK